MLGAKNEMYMKFVFYLEEKQFQELQNKTDKTGIAKLKTVIQQALKS